MQLVRMGNANKPEDLESQMVPDWKVKEVDLTIIEREVNKKKRKRAKAQRNGEMLSPLHTSQMSPFT